MHGHTMIGWATAAAIGFAAATAEAIEIERVLSPGGVEAWLVHEPSIPIIAVEMMWRSGARFYAAGIAAESSSAQAATAAESSSAEAATAGAAAESAPAHAAGAVTEDAGTTSGPVTLGIRGLTEALLPAHPSHAAHPPCLHRDSLDEQLQAGGIAVGVRVELAQLSGVGRVLVAVDCSADLSERYAKLALPLSLDLDMGQRQSDRGENQQNAERDDQLDQGQSFLTAAASHAPIRITLANG